MSRILVLSSATLSLAAVLAISGRAPAQDGLLRTQFERFDRDGDGRVTAEELGRPALFRRLDADGDGVVTWPETERALGGARRNPQPPIEDPAPSEPA
ncbi:MAG: EF-hand domain-containing protein, partial [Planctomycetota bacterium]